ncbi:MAG: GTP cyclohydrolase I FolE [Tissierellia bacterium]|nr:GTP cyclohydrolase I FolE [Tissierellia bacterium]
MDKAKIEKAVKMILEAVGEDPSREGLLDTPARVARMYEEIFAGLAQDPGRHLRVQFTEKGHDELVLVKNIPFYSTCEHHLVPFFGEAHIGYIPEGGRVVGLSKLARALEDIAKRPQLQERITSTLADTIMEEVSPWGVIVVIEAEHLCMSMRGVKKPGSKTVTSAVRGGFRTDAKSRQEALDLIKNG